MSSNTIVNTIVETSVADVATKTKAPKAPTLPAKFSRFMSFGYWFLSQMDTDILSETQRDQMFAKLMMFSSIDEQTAFYTDFLQNVTPSNKAIRKLVTAHNKPSKVKAPRAKKTKATVAQQSDMVAQLIEDANATLVLPVAETPVAEKPKKTKNTKTVEPAAETAEPAVVEKPKKTKKTKT
jgi:hypothetical protein